MNKYLRPLVVLFFSFLLIDCSEEEFPIFDKDYPVLYNPGASDINEGGVTLISRFSVPQGEEVLEFGFTVQDDQRVYDIPLHTWKEFSDFTYRLTGGLEAGRDYFYRPYATTTNYRLIGEYVRFTAQGSPTPELTEIQNTTLNIGERLLITGKNLHSLETDGLLRSGRGNIALSLRVIKGDVDTLSITIIPQVVTAGPENIVITSGTTELSLPGNFNINIPQIGSINTSSGFSNETVFVLNFLNYQPNLGRTQPALFLRDANDPNAELDPVIGAGFTDSSMSFQSSIEGTDGVKMVVARFTQGLEIEAGPITLTDRWQGVSNYPGSSTPVMSAIIDNNLYVLGSRQLHNYNWSAGTWTQNADFPGSSGTFRRFHFGLNNEVYAGSGNSNNTLYRYNTGSDNWTQLGGYDYGGTHLRIEGNINGNRSIIELVGGNSRYITYNPNSDSWTEVSIDPPAEYSNPTGPVPHLTYNGSLYFMPTVSELGEMKIVKVNGSGSNSTFQEISSRIDPDMAGRFDNSFHGSAMVKGDLAIFALNYRVNRVERVAWSYNFSTQEWSKISSKITQDITTSFNYQGELYGLVWNPSSIYHRNLVRFQTNLD